MNDIELLAEALAIYVALPPEKQKIAMDELRRMAAKNAAAAAQTIDTEPTRHKRAAGRRMAS